MAALMEVTLLSVYSIARFFGAGDKLLMPNIRSSDVIVPSLNQFSTTL